FSLLSLLDALPIYLAAHLREAGGDGHVALPPHRVEGGPAPADDGRGERAPHHLGSRRMAPRPAPLGTRVLGALPPQAMDRPHPPAPGAVGPEPDRVGRAGPCAAGLHAPDRGAEDPGDQPAERLRATVPSARPG